MLGVSLQAGFVVLDKYELVAPIGKGGMGEVWRAQHLALDAPVAIKFVDPGIVRHDESVQRFVREAKAAAALRGAHVVQILDYGVDRGIPFMVMELLEGESLRELLAREKKLAPALTAQIMTHIARAVGRAHEAGIVHRDLKPENVFLTRADEEIVAKVLDFGIAKVQATSEAEASTRTGALLGTPFYMSPEQAQGNKTVDFRADLWSMGVIAFECLTGEKPFYSSALGDLLLRICTQPIPVPSDVAEVPHGFDAWFARAAARDPAARFESARELAKALQGLCGADPSISAEATAPTLPAHKLDRPSAATTADTAGPLSRSVNSADKSRSRRWGLYAAIAVTLSALTSGAVYLVRNLSRSPAAATETPSGSAAVEPPTQAAPSEEHKGPSVVPEVSALPLPAESAPVSATTKHVDASKPRVSAKATVSAPAPQVGGAASAVPKGKDFF